MRSITLACVMTVLMTGCAATTPAKVREDDKRIYLEGDTLNATIRKEGYVTGVEAHTLVDVKTGFRDQGYGLDIVDWIMEPGSDEAYRDKLPGDLPYQFNNSYHGKIAKRSIEGPQICTKAGKLSPKAIVGGDFVAIQQDYHYHLAAPGKKTGSKWEQIMIFPAGKRYFISMDKITSNNSSDAMFLRLDMPGHIKHKNGDTFSEIYLSYGNFGGTAKSSVGEGRRIASSEFAKEFAPDERFLYQRDEKKGIPKRMIRAYRIRDPKTGAEGPWLAGMTLNAADVSEAWCHQRGYVCMIEEFGGRPIKEGESFSAAFIVGFFDSIEEMEQVYDQHAGHSGISLDEEKKTWKLIPSK